MLYFFKVLVLVFIKFGWTENENPFNRIQRGFWSNVHPKELCNRLGPENLELLYLFEGGKQLESVLQSLFPPDCGEIWTEEENLESMVQMLKLICEELPIPARPQLHPCDDLRKRACCTRILLKCYECGKNFASFDKLFQHKRDVHEPAKFSCACGRKFPRKGNLDRHVQKSCKLKPRH